MGLDAMVLVFWLLSFKPSFSLSSFTFIKRLFSSFPLSAIRLMSYMHAKLLQSCPTLCDPMDCCLPIFCVHGILQARILECVAMPSSRGFSHRGIQPCSPALAGGFFTTSAIWEALWSTSNCKVYCLISKCFDIFLISFYHWIFSLIPFWAVWLGFF